MFTQFLNDVSYNMKVLHADESNISKIHIRYTSLRHDYILSLSGRIQHPERPTTCYTD